MQADPYIYGLSRDQWTVVGIFIQAGAAIATVAAVVVSLWLAMRRRRPHVRLEVKYGYNELQNSECYQLEVTNLDERTIHVRCAGVEIQFCTGWHRIWKRYWLSDTLLPENRPRGFNDRGNELPYRLEHGEFTTLYILKSYSSHWFRYYDRPPINRPVRVRFYIVLSQGDVVRSTYSSKALEQNQGAYQLLLDNYHARKQQQQEPNNDRIE